MSESSRSVREIAEDESDVAADVAADDIFNLKGVVNRDPTKSNFYISV